MKDILDMQKLIIEKGRTDIKFYVMKPFNKEKATIGNGTMVTFLAESKKTVDQFHANRIKK